MPVPGRRKADLLPFQGTGWSSAGQGGAPRDTRGRPETGPESPVPRAGVLVLPTVATWPGTVLC
jgi:hypothetical protein